MNTNLAHRIGDADLSEDAFDPTAWERLPTALEVAHYNAMLNGEAKRETDRSRMIFGECLRQLMSLNMPQSKARSMLGKWRSQAKDDALLIRIVRTAYDIGSPDPTAYITKAIGYVKERTAKVDNLMSATWTLIGWERPRETPRGPRYRGATRGQIWRDPYGKYTVLPPGDDELAPTLGEDAGIDIESLSSEA